MMFIILMGVAGSGKTTVGRLIARRLGWHFYEGDDFHPAANRTKMHRGEPLTDEDRRPWLDALAELIHQCAQRNENAVLACSALKQAYRQRLALPTAEVRFVYLRGSHGLIAPRLASRRGHFFNPVLLQNQFDTLEEPSDALVVDISGTPDQTADQIIRALGLKPATP